MTVQWTVRTASGPSRSEKVAFAEQMTEGVSISRAVEDARPYDTIQCEVESVGDDVYIVPGRCGQRPLHHRLTSNRSVGDGFPVPHKGRKRADMESRVLRQCRKISTDFAAGEYPRPYLHSVPQYHIIKKTNFVTFFFQTPCS